MHCDVPEGDGRGHGVEMGSRLGWDKAGGYGDPILIRFWDSSTRRRNFQKSRYAIPRLLGARPIEFIERRIGEKVP